MESAEKHAEVLSVNAGLCCELVPWLRKHEFDVTSVLFHFYLFNFFTSPFCHVSSKRQPTGEKIEETVIH